MIELTNICKTFRVARRGSGMKSASKALFHREYEKIEALRNVSFTIQDGEMVGYIGPNGAGKSSSIKIMSALEAAKGACAQHRCGVRAALSALVGRARDRFL